MSPLLASVGYVLHVDLLIVLTMSTNTLVYSLSDVHNLQLTYYCSYSLRPEGCLLSPLACFFLRRACFRVGRLPTILFPGFTIPSCYFPILLIPLPFFFLLD